MIKKIIENSSYIYFFYCFMSEKEESTEKKESSNKFEHGNYGAAKFNN